MKTRIPSKKQAFGSTLQTKAKNQASCNAILQKYKHTNSSGNVAQLQTEIEHYTSDFTYSTSNGNETDTVGTKMVAYLDPSNPVTGSEPGKSEQVDLMKSLKANPGIGNKALVRGHLLNHDLGGYGVSENLFPITSKANHSHLDYVEYAVKDKLSEAEKNYQIGSTNNGVFYSVEVKSGLDDNSYQKGSRFICNACMVDNISGKNRHKHKPFIDNIYIESDPGKTSNNDGMAYDYYNNDADPFDLAESPKKWRKKGKGKRGRKKNNKDWDKELINKRIKVYP